MLISYIHLSILMSLYALFREGFDYDDEILYFTNKEHAINKMIRFLVENNYNNTACMLVYEEEENDDSFPMRLVEWIEPHQDFHTYASSNDITKEHVLDHPMILYNQLVFHDRR
jgi:hypothetical protein